MNTLTSFVAESWTCISSVDGLCPPFGQCFLTPAGVTTSQSFNSRHQSITFKASIFAIRGAARKKSVFFALYFRPLLSFISGKRGNGDCLHPNGSLLLAGGEPRRAK
jgi:hypothetical protein